MKPYFTYTADELAFDDLFMRWVQHPADDEVALFWQQYVGQHPVERSTFEKARTLVETLSQPLSPGLSVTEARALWEQIWQSVHRDSSPRMPDG